MGDTLQGADQIGPLEILGVVRPQVLQLLGKVKVAKLIEHVAHETGLAYRLLHLAEALCHDLFPANDAGDGASHFAQDVVRRIDGFLPGGERVGDGLHRLEPGVYDGHGEHPDAVLHAGREHGHLGEDALVCLAREDPGLRPLGAAVRPDNHHGRTEVLDEMPTGTGDGEEVQVRVHVSQDLDGRVVLEQQIHLNGDAADVLEDGRRLHVIRIRAKAIKAVRLVSHPRSTPR